MGHRPLSLIGVFISSIFILTLMTVPSYPSNDTCKYEIAFNQFFKLIHNEVKIEQQLFNDFCLIDEEHDQLPPICGICKCEKTLDKLELICNDGRFEQYLFDDSYWTNKENNKIIHYQNLIIQNTTLTTIHKQIPISTLILLDLSRNSIHEIQGNVFSRLQELVTLILSYNNIETFHPKALNGLYVENNYKPLRALKNLYLDHNRLTFLDSEVFAHATQIEVLSLAYNPIKELDVNTIRAITSLKHLKILDMSNTGLSSLPDDFMKYMSKKLNTLNLSGNYFKSVPQNLAYSSKLTTLYFNENPIEYLNSTTGFPKITSLKILYLVNMKHLTEIQEGGLTRLANLEELYLFNNSKLEILDEFSINFPPIRKLFLQNNNLSIIDDYCPFLNWSTIEELDLSNNSWICNCENKWMIYELILNYLENKAKSFRCSAPPEMTSYTLWDIYINKSLHCKERKYNEYIIIDWSVALLILLITFVCLGLLVLCCMHMFSALEPFLLEFLDILEWQWNIELLNQRSIIKFIL